VDGGPTPYILRGGERSCSQEPAGQSQPLQKQWRRENYCTYWEHKSVRPFLIMVTALTELLRSLRHFVSLENDFCIRVINEFTSVISPFDVTVQSFTPHLL